MSPQAFTHWLSDAKRTPLVMGVLNVTPDSFSDGGQFDDPASAADAGLKLLEEGADLLDVGGESTRPGSNPVPPEEQLRRVIPVIERVRRQADVLVSIDTTRSEVAAAALDAGAGLLNDVSAGRDDGRMLALAASRKAPIVLMHMLGTPQTMQDSPPHYEDVVGEVVEFLRHRTAAAMQAGVDVASVLLDPGFGFGKTTAHNLTLLRELPRFVELGRPVLVGTSRKRFIGQVLDEADPLRRTWGTAATVAWAVMAGAGIVRVHDVAEMKQVVRMTAAIRSGELPQTSP